VTIPRRAITSSEFESLLVSSSSFIDVRAPIEFSSGSLPGAVNLPLLSDEERHEVGLTYRQLGQEAAISTGHRLVAGDIRAGRTQSWLNHIQKHPESILYCFRGGLRSQTVQKWLGEKGVDRPLIEGGYKALRRFLLEVLEHRISKLQFLVVGGATGSGKTRYLYSTSAPCIDLEKLAVHRGSAFGALESPQPSQASFENSLAIELLKLPTTHSPILIENESQRIGRCTIPQAFFSKIQSSPKITLAVPLEQRVENIYQDYILNSSLGLRGDALRFAQFRRALIAISKKLGSQRSEVLLNNLATSEKEFRLNGTLESNRVWIQKLLVWYYDPLYQKSAKAREPRAEG